MTVNKKKKQKIANPMLLVTNASLLVLRTVGKLIAAKIIYSAWLCLCMCISLMAVSINSFLYVQALIYSENATKKSPPKICIAPISTLDFVVIPLVFSFYSHFCLAWIPLLTLRSYILHFITSYYLWPIGRRSHVQVIRKRALNY
jgi:hypothetical protein